MTEIEKLKAEINSFIGDLAKAKWELAVVEDQKAKLQELVDAPDVLHNDYITLERDGVESDYIPMAHYRKLLKKYEPDSPHLG